MIPYGMKQDDARKLDHATLEAMRIRAVRSVQAGENPEVVARSLRISRRTIYGWLAQYRRGGWGALKAKPLFGSLPIRFSPTATRASVRPCSWTSVQRLPFPARHRGRRHRADLRRALLRSLAGPYMLGVWVETG